MVTGFFMLPVRKLLKRPDYRYLLLLVVSTLGAVFIFDPKLGMPLDWDLFSYPGIPVSVFGYYYLLDNRRQIKSLALIPVLAISLGFLSLVPRVLSQAIPDVSLAHFRNYIALDNEKNRNSRVLLVNYYRDNGDTAAAQLELIRWKTDHPEEGLMRRCNELYYKERRLDQTVALLKKILEINSVNPDAYSFLGFCYLDLKRYDSALALIKIANGLRPYNASILNNLGLAYAYKQDYKKARKAFLQSISLDTTTFQPLYNLAGLYRSLNEKEKYREYLVKVALREDAPAFIARELCLFYLKEGQYERAARACESGLRKGLDSGYIEQLKVQFPQLKRWLR